LKDLLLRAARRVGGDLNASPAVNLKTKFGGGKTHSMLALWHRLSGRELAEYPQALQELLAGQQIGPCLRVSRDWDAGCR
jgi:predicted AAA+ superfamily ATPase